MTDLETIRFLINDESEPQNFTDDQIQSLLDLNDGSVFMACALACDKLAIAAGAVGGATSVKIGSYSESTKGTTLDYQTMADRFRELENNQPAFGIAQGNYSEFNELDMIRDYLLKTS